MDIYPQDLGNSNYTEVLKTRGFIVGTRHKMRIKESSSLLPAPLTPLRRMWMRGLPVNDEAAEHAMPAFNLCNCVHYQVVPIGFKWTVLKALVFGFIFVPLVIEASPFLVPPLVLYFGYIKPRMILNEIHQKLGVDDLSVLYNKTSDPLLRDFYGLVMSAIQMSGTALPQDVEDMRMAFYALGNSISRLPQINMTAEDVAQLKLEARSLLVSAETEIDPVVAASFQRQAEAILQRATSADHSNIVLRRSQVLRNELREQIRVLQASLNTTFLSADQQTGQLSEAAASIQRIAGQANAVAAARAEVEGMNSVAIPINNVAVEAELGQAVRRRL